MSELQTLLPFALALLALLLVAEAFGDHDRRRRVLAATLGAVALLATAAAGLAEGAGAGAAAIAAAAGVVLVSVAALFVVVVRSALAARTQAGRGRGLRRVDAGAEAAARAPPAASADDATAEETAVFGRARPGDIVRGVEIAARRAGVTIFAQDKDLRYSWILAPRLGWRSEGVVGRDEWELLPADIVDSFVEPKRHALRTGEPQVFQVTVPGAAGETIFLIDVIPVETASGEREIVCFADDITRDRELEAARADLSRRLSRTLRQLRLTLKSGRIAVASQDRDLVYRWAEGDFGGVADSDLVGQTDDALFGPEDAAPLVELKRGVLSTGDPGTVEVGIGAGAGRRFFDVHVEPDVDSAGTIVGVTSAAVEVTHRRRNEEQMRQVLRELTHRTKNLLAVTIAIARQTAGSAASPKDYAEALIGRLRALSAAQDLIVADDWAGVDLSELVWLQLAQCQGAEAVHFDVEGPAVTLSPEVSQSLALAIHELASNALRHGAFSVPGGRVGVRWRIERDGAGDGAGQDVLVLEWSEIDGPEVREPVRRGFGMSVLERTVKRSLEADVAVAFEADGLSARFRIPLRQGIAEGA